MTRYEVVFIVHPDRSDEEARKVAERLGETVAREGGEVLKVEEWGKRKLAYKVQKQLKGIYILMQIAGTGKVLNEVERMLRISDDVLKYLSVKLDEEDEVAAGSASASQQSPAGGRGAEEGAGGPAPAPVAAEAAAGRETA